MCPPSRAAGKCTACCHSYTSSPSCIAERLKLLKNSLGALRTQLCGFAERNSVIATRYHVKIQGNQKIDITLIIRLEYKEARVLSRLLDVSKTPKAKHRRAPLLSLRQPNARHPNSYGYHCHVLPSVLIAKPYNMPPSLSLVSPSCFTSQHFPVYKQTQ